MHADVGQAHQAVIYGADERHDVFEEADPELAALASRHSVAIVSRRNVSSGGDRVQIDAVSAGDAFGLCEGERFATEPSGAFCSGLLVEPDLVLTAAHCTFLFPCSEWRVVRGFEMTTERELRVLSTEDVAGCLGIATDPDPAVDVAWVRLDRALGSFAKVPAPASSPGAGDPLILVGNALGVPTKIDAGGAVTDAGTGDYFMAALDNFVGGSGSGVFDGQGHVVGVATAGATDFVDDARGCRTARRLLPPEGTEKVFRLERALAIPLSALPEREPPRGSPGTSCSVGSPRGGAVVWQGFVAVVALAWLRAQSCSFVRRARAASWDAGSAVRRESSSRR